MPSFVVHFSAFFLESMQQCVHGSVCLLHIVTLHVVLLLLYISQSANNKCTAFLISRTRRTRPLPGLRSHPGLIELFITNSLGFLRDNHEGYLLLMTSRQTHNTKGTRYWDANIKLHMYFFKVALHFQKLHLYFSKLLGY